MRCLVWFRNDLRLADNPALSHACRCGSEGVIAAFNPCFTQWRAHDWGEPKIDFILRQVHWLSAELGKRGIPLKLVAAERFEHTPAALLSLAQQHECGGLAFNLEYEVNEATRDQKAIEAFEHDGREVTAFHDQNIIPPSALHTGEGGYYRVFTPFRRAWMTHIEDGFEWRPKPAVKPKVKLDLAADRLPDPPLPHSTIAALWPAGADHAMRLLKRFIEHWISLYPARRDLPAADATSTLSPCLAAGVISTRQCLAAVCDAFNAEPEELPEGPDVWIRQLIWRDFYRHVLMGYPHVCRNQPFQHRMRRLPWREAPRDLQAWQAGCTGYPFVDAAMRSLSATGWLHNRLRMVVAMFLCKHLRIDWRCGERHFNRMLVDADFANNNGGWQWSASTGTDAAPYFRVFNPTTQSRRFDPDGRFIRNWCEELADIEGPAIHEPATVQRRAAGYPEPIVDHTEARKRAIDMFKMLDQPG